jgi:hypothetical protein
MKRSVPVGRECWHSLHPPELRPFLRSVVLTFPSARPSLSTAFRGTVWLQLLKSTNPLRWRRTSNGAQSRPRNPAATGFGVTPHLVTSWCKCGRPTENCRSGGPTKTNPLRSLEPIGAGRSRHQRDQDASRQSDLPCALSGASGGPLSYWPRSISESACPVNGAFPSERLLTST